ncbi:MAG: hypothetical protein PHQ00_00105, partial [Phycisphaerae bacterium]|nr:hypothetical protein [Phycisphaerae bacterium]
MDINHTFSKNQIYHRETWRYTSNSGRTSAEYKIIVMTYYVSGYGELTQSWRHVGVNAPDIYHGRNTDDRGRLLQADNRDYDKRFRLIQKEDTPLVYEQLTKEEQEAANLLIEERNKYIRERIEQLKNDFAKEELWQTLPLESKR